MNVIKTVYNRDYFEEFSSIADFKKGLERPRNGRFADSYSSETVALVADEGWFGTRTIEEADSLMANGYDVGADKLMKKVLAVHNTATKPRQVASVVGYAPIVPNALRGVPKTMFATKNIKKPVPLRKVFIINTAGARIDGEKLLDSGAVMLNVCNQLEMAGVRTEIVSIPKFSYTVNRNLETFSIGCSIKIKDYKEQFSFKKMAYIIAHTSMFRRHGFKFMETCGAQVSLKNRFTSTYGRSFANDHEKTVSKLKELGLVKGNDIVLTYNLIDSCGFDLNKVMERLGLNK